MHPDFRTNNLKLQKASEKSHFKHYQQLTRIRKFDQFVYGNFEMKSLQTKVLAYKRYAMEKIKIITKIVT